MTPHVLLALYGAIVIGGLFLVFNMGRLAVLEFWDKGAVAFREVYFWLSANQSAQAVFVGGICAVRAIDILAGQPAASSASPWVLVGCFAGLLLTKTGFNYASTLTMKRGKLVWRSLLAATLAWWVFVAFWVPL